MINKQQGIILPIIIAIIAALSIGYYVFTREGAPLQAPVTTGGCEKGDSKCVKESQTADWKTYTNTQYGFEFKYPGNGVVKEGDSEMGGFHGISIDLGQPGSVPSTITIQIYPSTNLSAERYVDHVKGERRTLMVAGQPAIEVIPSEKDYAYDSQGNKRSWFAFSNGNYVYVMQNLGPTAEIAHQVVSMISLTPPQPPQAATGKSWKIYYDTQYGFGFNYPDNFRIIPNIGSSIIQIARVINVQHCTAKPECVPTTNNPLISFSVSDFSYQSYLNQGPVASPVSFGSLSGSSYSEGVEGEGDIVYLFPLGNKTLIVKQSYINEDVVGFYRGQPDYLNLALQESITDQILSTLRFTNALPVSANPVVRVTDEAISQFMVDWLPTPAFRENARVNQIVRGDLNGDGFVDAVATLFSCDASCGDFEFIILDNNGLPRKSDAKFPSFGYGYQNPSLKILGIQYGVIKAEQVINGQDIGEHRYKLVGESLVELPR